MNNNYKNIFIEFPTDVDTKDFDGDNTLESSDLCEFLLVDYSNDVFGFRPTCKFASNRII